MYIVITLSLSLLISQATLTHQVPHWRLTDEVRAFCPQGHANYNLCLQHCERNHRWADLATLATDCAPVMEWDYQILLYRRQRWPVVSTEVYPRIDDRMINCFVVDLRQSGFELPDDLSTVEQIIVNPWDTVPNQDYCFDRMDQNDDGRGFEVSVFNATMDDFECGWVAEKNERKCVFRGSLAIADDIPGHRFNYYPGGPEWDGEDPTTLRVRFNVTEFGLRYNTRSLKDALLFHRHKYESTCDALGALPGFIEVIDRHWVRGDNLCEKITDCQQCQSAINCDWCLTPAYEYKCTDYCVPPWKLDTCNYVKETAYSLSKH